MTERKDGVVRVYNAKNVSLSTLSVLFIRQLLSLQQG